MILKKLTVDDQVVDIVTKGGNQLGNLSKCVVANTSASNTVKVSIYLEDASAVKHHYIKSVLMPTETSLTFDLFGFNKDKYHLRAVADGTSPLVDIILTK
tara:strand:- start:131 stop:430 length:300 start_codon:yes stop_codon:yes gene_type:complete